jgi:glutathione S-transferase
LTLKLYYKAGACSLAPHIVACEAGVPVELVAVDLATKKTASGDDYYKVNPNGYVPALEIPGGPVLTEASVVCQYIADQKPESGLMPAPGSIDRYRAQQWLAFISTELHKTVGVFFKPNSTDQMKEIALAALDTRLRFLDSQLAGSKFLVGDSFTAADAYATVVLSWMKFAGIDLANYPNIKRFQDEVAARPGVQQARREEGLPV